MPEFRELSATEMKQIKGGMAFGLNGKIVLKPIDTARMQDERGRFRKPIKWPKPIPRF